MGRNEISNAPGALETLLMFSLLTFVFHFSWEILQAPLFARMPTMSHWQATLVCLKATFGDVGIALAGFAAAALWDQNSRWFIAPSAGALIAYLTTGLLITIAFEWHAVHWANRWAYSDVMPIVPVIRVGLAPVMQWIILPTVVFFLLQRHRMSVG